MRNSSRFARFGTVSAIALNAALLFIGAASARTAPGASADEAGGSGDIMVTARRKTESLLDTPITISATLEA